MRPFAGSLSVALSVLKGLLGCAALILGSVAVLVAVGAMGSVVFGIGDAFLEAVSLAVQGAIQAVIGKPAYDFIFGILAVLVIGFAMVTIFISFRDPFKTRRRK